MLPKTEHPLHDFTIPSTKKKIKYRSFLVKDKRNLLVALESQNDTEILSAVKQLITNCVVDPGFDVDSMATFDVELFFLHLRAKSDSDVVDGTYICENVTDGGRCGNRMDIRYNIGDTTLTETEGHSTRIMLSPTTGIIMRYPTFAELEKYQNVAQDAAWLTFEFIADCVDCFFDAENIYKAHEVGPEKIVEYLENLTVAQFAEIEKFFATMPVLRKVIDHKCNKCGFDHKIPLEGLQSFFAF